MVFERKHAKNNVFAKSTNSVWLMSKQKLRPCHIIHFANGVKLSPLKSRQQCELLQISFKGITQTLKVNNRKTVYINLNIF